MTLKQYAYVSWACAGVLLRHRVIGFVGDAAGFVSGVFGAGAPVGTNVSVEVVESFAGSFEVGSPALLFLVSGWASLSMAAPFRFLGSAAGSAAEAFGAAFGAAELLCFGALQGLAPEALGAVELVA